MRRGFCLILLLANCWCGIGPVAVIAAEVIFDPSGRAAQKPVLHVPLVRVTSTASTGQPLKFQGSVGFTTFQGMMCANFDTVGNIRVDCNSDAFCGKPGTVTLWINPQSNEGVMHALDLGDLTAQDQKRLLSICVKNGYLAWSCGALDITTPVYCSGRWSFIAIVFNGIRATLYCDGKIVEDRIMLDIFDKPQVCIGGSPNVYNNGWRGYLAGVTVYDQELTQYELINLANQFQQRPSAAANFRDNRSSDEDLVDKYKHLGISISRKDGCITDDIVGDALNKEEFKVAAAQVIAALNKLPESCIKNSGINDIVILSNLRYQNVPVSGFTRGDCMYFSLGADDHMIYHEFFHRFDNQKQSAVWKRFNADKFTYLDRGNSSANKSRFTSGKPGGIQKLVDNNRPFVNDFVSSFAMNNERDDRAETFAAMVEEGPSFLSRTERSQALKQKMQYIIELTDSSNIMGKNYWPEHLNLKLE